MAYLPMYVIETKETQSARSPSRMNADSYYYVYTGIRDFRDLYFERIINNTPAIKGAFSLEKDLEPSRIWNEWLSERKISGVIPLERSDGTWQITLPASVFTDSQSSFSTDRIGDYEVRRGYFMQIWCDDSY
jgi:hypothetical protein